MYSMSNPNRRPINPSFNPNRQFTYNELNQINRNVNQAFYRQNGVTPNGYQNPADDPQQARIHERHNVPVGRVAWYEEPGALTVAPSPPRPTGDTTGHSMFNPPASQNNSIKRNNSSNSAANSGSLFLSSSANNQPSQNTSSSAQRTNNSANSSANSAANSGNLFASTTNNSNSLSDQLRTMSAAQAPRSVFPQPGTAEFEQENTRRAQALQAAQQAPRVPRNSLERLMLQHSVNQAPPPVPPMPRAQGVSARHYDNRIYPNVPVDPLQAANINPLPPSRNTNLNLGASRNYDDITQINRNVNQAFYRENGMTPNGFQNPADDPQQMRIHQRHNVPTGREAWFQAPGALNHVPTPPRPMGDTTGHSLFNPPPSPNRPGQNDPNHPNYQNPRGGINSIKKRKKRRSKSIRRKKNK